MRWGLIFKLENEQKHYQGELYIGKIFYVRNCYTVLIEIIVFPSLHLNKNASLLCDLYLL